MVVPEEGENAVELRKSKSAGMFGTGYSRSELCTIKQAPQIGTLWGLLESLAELILGSVRFHSTGRTGAAGGPGLTRTEGLAQRCEASGLRLAQ